MSTASLPPRSTANQPHPSDGLIGERIDAVRSALWRSELTRSLLLLVLFVIAAILGWAIIDQWIWSGGPMVRLAAWAATAGLIIVWSMRRIVPLFTSHIDAAYAAYSIERDIPDIKHALSSYVALRDQRDVSGLRGVVVRSIGLRAAGRLKQHEGVLPSEVASSFQLWIMVAVAFAVLATYTVFSPKNTIHSAGRLILPLSSIDPPTRVRILEVNPGHTETVAGRNVDVTARIVGLNDADDPHVLWELGGERRKIPLRVDEQRGLPFFQASLGGSHGIEASGHYTVRAGDANSERFRITTSDVPVVRVDSVHYQPPAYTKQPERTSRAAAIEGIEGTAVTLVASTNRPITEAQIELNPRTAGGRTTATAGVFPMQIDSTGTKITAKIVLRIGADQPGVVPLNSYRMRITDSDGVKNPEPIVYPIRILPDLTPEVTIATPVRHPKEVPVDAQQLIEVHALDPDFGLTKVALQMFRGSQQLEDVVLWQEDDSEPRNRIALYRLRPRSLGLHPGDVIRIRAVAADNRVHPRKQTPAPNITVSDPVELRIVEAANMNESRPSEDGLSAPDDQPAVDPPKSDQSESGDQQQENSDSASTGSGSGGDSGSEEESSGEGDSSEGGSASESSAEGEQEGSAGREQGEQGSGEGSGSQAGDQSAAGSAGDQEGAEAGGEPDQAEMTGDGSTSDGGADQSPAGAAPDSQSPSPQAENGGEETQSTSPDAGGESPAGSDAQGTQSQATRPQEGADGSTADGEAPADRDSPPEHDGEAFERIKEYLDEQQKNVGKPSPAEQSSDQRNGEADASGGDQEMPADVASQNGGERDPASQETSISDNGTADDGSSQDDDASHRSGQGGDSTERADRSSDPSSAEPSESEPSESEPSESEPSEGEPAEGEPAERESSDGEPSDAESSSEPGTASDASETDPAGEASEGDSADGASESERDRSASSNNGGTDDAGTSTTGSPSEPAESGPESDGAPASPESDATPSSQDPATSEPQDREPPPSPAEQRSPDDQPTAANGSDPDGDSPPSSAETSATTGRAGSMDSGESTSDFVESQEAPEPVDTEYAKKATDMVLDYLKETRERPDQELLDRLNWSEEDMNRFLNRWESARQMQRGNGGDGSQEFEEALRSLGIRDRSTAGRGAKAAQADRLRDLRDSGTRRPAPTLYRDAFEAFRRSVAR